MRSPPLNVGVSDPDACRGGTDANTEACNVTSSKLDLCLIEVTAVAAALGYLISSRVKGGAWQLCSCYMIQLPSFVSGLPVFA